MTKSEKKLLEQFKTLPDEAKKSLLDFCAFLTTQHSDVESALSTPKNLPRPKDESVVLAMRRLSDTYFMLNKDDLLHEASSLMSQHILQGRDAVDVIDELEVLFKKKYDELTLNTNALLEKE